MTERHLQNVRAAQPANPIVLSPALLRTPIAGPYLVATPWARWLQASWGRQGGAQAPSNAELDSGLSTTNDDLSQTQDDLSQTQDDLGQTQTTVEGLEGELTALQEAYLETVQDLEALTTRVSALETTVAAQETRLAALEAWKTALQAALPALVTVTPVPTLPVAPATPTALRDSLTTTWEPNVNTNDAALQTAVNAISTALAA